MCCECCFKFFDTTTSAVFSRFKFFNRRQIECLFYWKDQCYANWLTHPKMPVCFSSIFTSEKVYQDIRIITSLSSPCFFSKACRLKGIIKMYTWKVMWIFLASLVINIHQVWHFWAVTILHFLLILKSVDILSEKNSWKECLNFNPFVWRSTIQLEWNSAYISKIIFKVFFNFICLWQFSLAFIPAYQHFHLIKFSSGRFYEVVTKYFG